MRTKLLLSAMVIAGVGAVCFGVVSLARADQPEPNHLLAALRDKDHPGITMLCPATQKDGELRIQITDSGSCSVILPPPAPVGFTCRAVVDQKGKAPVSFECNQQPGLRQ